MIGININCKHHPFTDMILSGQKTIETRNSKSLHPYVGQTVGLVKTGCGQAVLVGYATIGKPIYYANEDAFRKDESKHCVHKGSEYDIGAHSKWGYPIFNVVRIQPRYIHSKGIVTRKI